MIWSACGSQLAATAAGVSISSVRMESTRSGVLIASQRFLPGANKIVFRQDPKTADAEIITVVGFERYSDHTVLDVRYQNGSREKWMK